MGLGGGPDERDDYEWVRLADLPDEIVGSRWLPEVPVWVAGAGRKVLLVDLDNVRATPQRLGELLQLLMSVAAEADCVHLAGQREAVGRSARWLSGYTDAVVTVGAGPDLADHALLDAALADTRPRGRTQFAVASNDGIFALLARHGLVTLLSPSLDAASKRLRAAASREFDLSALPGGRHPGRTYARSA